MKNKGGAFFTGGIGMGVAIGVALRAVPVVEAMAACVLADAMLRHRAQVG